MARIISLAFAEPGLTGSPSRRVTLASRRRVGRRCALCGGLSGRPSIRLTSGDHRPERARRLVRNGDRRDVYRSPRQQLLQPRPRLGILAEVVPTIARAPWISSARR